MLRYQHSGGGGRQAGMDVRASRKPKRRGSRPKNINGLRRRRNLGPQELRWDFYRLVPRVSLVSLPRATFRFQARRRDQVTRAAE